jgi:hypothetical protein
MQVFFSPQNHEPEMIFRTRSKRSAKNDSPRPRRRRWWLWVLIILVVVLAIARAIMPWAVRYYVNRTLDRSPLYTGKIGPVGIHLWRGAYSVQNIRISKTTASVPVPFFSARKIDFGVEWRALFHGRIVCRVSIDKPEINFVDSSKDDNSQTGSGGDWLQMIRQLSPFTINSATVQDGSIHFRTFEASRPVDVYISQLNASVNDLGNVRDESKPLVASVHATARVMNQATFELNMTLDPFAYRPTFRLTARLLGLDVTTINDLALTYGKFDFKRGWFDLVIDVKSEQGQISGYIKPLFRDLSVFSLSQDIKQDNPLRLFWQAMIGAATQLLKNQPRNQFGTLIPFTADAAGTTSADILATVGNLLRNAFVRAYLPRLENSQSTESDLHFQAPESTEALSTGGSE